MSMSAFAGSQNQLLTVTAEKATGMRELLFNLGFSLYEDFGAYHFMAKYIPSFSPEFSLPERNDRQSEAGQISWFYDEIVKPKNSFDFASFLSGFDGKLNLDGKDKTVKRLAKKVKKVAASFGDDFSPFFASLIDMLSHAPDGQIFHYAYSLADSLSQITKLDRYSKFNPDEIRVDSEALKLRLLILGESLFSGSRFNLYQILSSGGLESLMDKFQPEFNEFKPINIYDSEFKSFMDMDLSVKSPDFNPANYLDTFTLR